MNHWRYLKSRKLQRYIDVLSRSLSYRYLMVLFVTFCVKRIFFSKTNSDFCRIVFKILMNPWSYLLDGSIFVTFWKNFFYPPHDSGGGYSHSGCPSVTLSCLRVNLSKHGWIWIIFCMWLVIIIILDGLLHGNIWSKGFGGKS